MGGPKSRIQRPIIQSMMDFHQGPLNVRVEDSTFFQALIDERPNTVKFLVERESRFVDVGSSNVIYETAQQATGLPRILLLPEHREWIREVYGDDPVGRELIIEQGNDPFTFVFRDPSSMG